MKTSYIMYTLWNRPILNGLCFSFISLDSLGYDDVSLKGHLWSKESALSKITK